MPPQIVIAGYYGFANTGDEAILAAILNEIRRELPDAGIAVMSGNVVETSARFGVHAFTWNDPQELLHRIEAADLLIIGGGGLFHDYWGVAPDLLFQHENWGMGLYVASSILAALLKRRTMLWAVGVGPLFSPLGRECARTVCALAQAITVRDQESLDVLREIGVSPDRISIASDPVFGHVETTSATQEIRLPKTRPGPLVGVALRPWIVGVDSAYWERQVAEALDWFVTRFAGTVAFIPFQSLATDREDDGAVAERVRAKMTSGQHAFVVARGLEPVDVRATIGQCDLVLGMRFHSIVFAAQSAVPVVSLGYDNKVTALMRKLDLDEFNIPIDSLKANLLASRLEQAWQRRAELASKLRQKTAELAGATRAPIQIAVELLRKTPEPVATLPPESLPMLTAALKRQITLSRDLRTQIDNLKAKLAVAEQTTRSVAGPTAPGIETIPEARVEVGPPESADRDGPLISVILPVWNHAHVLPEAVRSVLRQTHRNLELIVVDDGSDVNLEPLFREFQADARFRWIRRQHEGLPQTLSAGFRHASGRFYTWTSADNRMHPNMLATLLDFLLRHPGVDMTYADMDLIGEDGQPLFSSQYRVSAQRPGATNQLRLPRTVQTLGIVNDNFIGASFLYRAEIGRILGEYDNALLGTEDYDYWLRLGSIGRIAHCGHDECLYSYRVHDDSLSGRHAPEIGENAVELIAFHRDRLAFYGKPLRVVLVGEAEGESGEITTLARAFERAGYTVHLGPEIPQSLLESDDKALVLCFSQQRLRDVARAIKTARQKPFVILRQASIEGDVGANLDPDLTWVLCESEANAAELPVELSRNWSLWNPPSLAFEEELMMALKARDNTCTLWDVPEFREPLILFLGPLKRELADSRALIRVAKDHPEATLLLISTCGMDGPDVAEMIPRASNCIFLGRKNVSEWYPYLSRATVLLAPYLALPEADARIQDAMISYLAAGKPIAATHAVALAGFADAPNITFATAEEFSSTVSRALPMKPDLSAADEYLRRLAPESVARQLAGIANTRLFYHRERIARSPMNSDQNGQSPESAGTTRFKCLIETESLHRGGLERVVANMARELQRVNASVIIAVTRESGDITRECREGGIPVREVESEERLADLIAQEQPDILIPHFANAGARIAFRAGIPVLSFIHNSYVWVPETLDEQIRLTDYCVTRYISVSQSAKRYFCRKYGVNPQKVICVPNGIDVRRLEQRLRVPARIRRETLDLDPRDIVWLNVASIVGTKAQLHAICAIRSLIGRYPRLRLIMVGPTLTPDYHSVLTEAVKEFGLAAHVRFVPHTDELPDYYRLADAFLLPSIIEGWSLAMTEAMFFGLPLVLTDVGGAGEVIEDNDIGILVPPAYADPLDLDPAKVWDLCTSRSPRNLTALVSAIEQVSSDLESWKGKARAGTAKVRKSFDTRQVAAEQLREIEDLIFRQYGRQYGTVRRKPPEQHVADEPLTAAFQ